MKHLLRHAARWLFSAGVFTLGSLVLTSSARAAGPSGGLVGTAGVATDPVRLEAMKVEIALFADPITYAMPLQIRSPGTGIELHGVVASEAVRQRALALARGNCALPIADRMTLVGATRADSAGLQRAVRERLVHGLGAQADAVRVDIHGDGRVTLTGRVRTLEEKWLASRALLKLPSCTALVNQLEVTGTAHPSFTLVARGAGEESGPALNPGPVRQAGNESAEVPAGKPRPLQVMPPGRPAAGSPAPTVPSGLPANRLQLVERTTYSRNQDPAPKVTYVVPGNVSKVTDPASGVAQDEQPTWWGRFRASLRREPLPSRSPMTVPARPIAPQYRVTAPPPARPIEPPHLPQTIAAPVHRVETPALAGPTPVVPQPAGTLYQSRPLEYLRRSAARRPQVIPTVPEAPTVPAPAHATPVVAPVAHSAAASEAVRPASAVEAPKAVVKPIPRSVPATAELHRKVKAACGKLARDVRVEKAADGALAVHVYTAPGGEQILTTRLLTVPELMGSSIRLHIHLAE